MPLSNTVNLLGRATKVVGGVTPGVGNVSGPSSSTNNALVRWDTTTGKLIKDSNVTLADSGTALVFSGAAGLTSSGSNTSITLTPSGTGDAIIASTDARLKLVDSGTTYGIFGLSSGHVNFGAVTANYVAFLTGNTERMRLATSGNLLLGGLPTDGTGVLQFPAATTSAGGITFGTDLNIFRISGDTLGINGSSAFNVQFQTAGTTRLSLASSGASAIIQANTGGGLIFNTNSGNAALTLDSSQNQQNAGTINHAGQKVVSTQYDTINTTLATVTGLSVTVVAGKTYTFRARLHVTADAVGGLKYTVAGTATATSVVWQQIAYNSATGAVVGSSRTAALGTTSNFITTTSDYITIDGSIVVNAGGTLVIQAAQQAANGTSSVLINSSLVVWGG